MDYDLDSRLSVVAIMSNNDNYLIIFSNKYFIRIQFE